MTVVQALSPAANNDRPVWQSNKESSTCTKCEREFTIYHRRHHCRGCGRLVCDKCSAYRIALPEAYGCGAGPLRACAACYDLHMSARYEAELQRGEAQPPDFGALRAELLRAAERYLALPEEGWGGGAVHEERGVALALQPVEGSSLLAVRSTMVVRAPLERTSAVYGNMELWRHWNPHVTSRILQQVDATSKVVAASYDFPVLAQRDSCFFTVTLPHLPHATHSPRKAQTSLAMSIEHPKCPPVKGVVRAHVYISMTMLSESEDGTCTHFTSIVHTDPRGLLPPVLVNRFLSRGVDHLYGMAKYVETH
eukprot:jgi/Mesen1/8538/ME000484S07921